ncbi:MAG: dihydrodipicolinate reductase [Desulfobacteraceae bacterium]|nr:dihydrodipicolinate reductase [Desulfobacteraceae bacterium]
MEKVQLMINGIPGNLAMTIASHVITDDRFTLVPFSLTGPEIEADTHTIDGVEVRLVKPGERDTLIKEIIKAHPGFITIDYTHPTAVNANGEFYVNNDLPFVMGTTGGDREKLLATVAQGKIPALIAPNMAKQIVGFQAMMDYAATTFPDLFKDYSLTIEESHQQTKADTSGTAKAMVGYYNRLGIPFSEDDIEQVRNPEIQKNQWNIPEEHLSGHAWHTYTLTSPDGSACFQFKHNINGRNIYIDGTLDGALFLNQRLTHGSPDENLGKVYTMIDVLKLSNRS